MRQLSSSRQCDSGVSLESLKEYLHFLLGSSIVVFFLIRQLEDLVKNKEIVLLRSLFRFIGPWLPTLELSSLC